MATVKEILSLIQGLSPTDQTHLMTVLLEGSPNTSKLEQILTENRFANGLLCPLCGCIDHISRNGRRKDGKQRYICKDCGKSFVANTNSITSGTRKNLETWKKYIGCMIQGLPVRKTAEICGIHRNTAFIWRHKRLDALQNVSRYEKLEGIVEADETFFPVSFRGNHKKGPFMLPRARKRGKSNRTRRVSRELVCVPCAVDRAGHAVSMIATLGRIKTRDLHLLYDDKISEDVTLCTDKMNSYVRFANSNNLNLVQLKSGKAKKGIYHIQHVNSYHNSLKRFIRGFNGVALKYLNNYLLWNSWLIVKKSSMQHKVDSILKAAITANASVKCRSLSSRPVIPLIS